MFGPAVTDANGAGISGLWTNSSSTFPSGNGLAGSQFNFQIDVLPGDVNQNGTVNSQDSGKRCLGERQDDWGHLGQLQSVRRRQRKRDDQHSGLRVAITNANLKTSNITNPTHLPAVWRVGIGLHGPGVGRAREWPDERFDSYEAVRPRSATSVRRAWRRPPPLRSPRAAVGTRIGQRWIFERGDLDREQPRSRSPLVCGGRRGGVGLRPGRPVGLIACDLGSSHRDLRNPASLRCSSLPRFNR